MDGFTTFASTNKTSGIFWANPKVDFLYHHWFFILNDVHNRKLQLLYIPPYSLDVNDLNTRNNKPDLLDINLEPYSLLDARTCVDFCKYQIDKINY